MNKMNKTARILLAVALVLCLSLALGITAFAADDNVAKIGDTEYATLQAAMTEANKAAGDYTITLLKDSAEVFTFAQKSGVNITIDGDGNTFTGKITLNAGGGNLTFTDAKITPANSQTIYLNASTAPNVTFDGCTLEGANKSGTIIYGYASATSNALTVKNCTADNLQYIISHRQTGAKSVLVENVTATNMIYVARTLKCSSVTLKDVTADAVIGVEIKNDAAGGKLTLENVNINIVTYNGSLYVPVSGSGAGNSWTVELKGENIFSANGVAYRDTSWFSGNAGYMTDIGAQNDTKFGSLAAIADNAKAGDTVKLLKETDATVELAYGITLDKNGFEAPNVTVEEPEFTVMIGEQGYATLADALAVAKDCDIITLLADNAEIITFAQNGGKITIDGNGKTFTGKITLNAGYGELVITNATLTPSNADAKTIVLNASTAPNITIDGCTMNNVGTKGAIVWGQASNTNNKVVIKNSTASNLQYLVGTNQAGCDDITIENVTATAMAYLIRPMKAAKVTVKDVTYSGLTFVQVKNSNIGTLAIENVTVTTTQAGMPPITMLAPDSGSGALYTITLKGENIANGAEMTTANEASWFATAAANLPYEIINLNGLKGSGTEADPYQIRSLADLILFRDSVNAGETKYNAEGVYVALTADIDLASVENWEPIGNWDYSFDGNFNGNGKKIMNLKMSDNSAANGEAYLGFFGITANNTIENFVIENVTIESNGQIVAAAIAYPYYTTVKDITVCGDIAIKGGNYTAGVLAYTRLCQNASNLTVSGNAGSYITGAQVVGGVIADIQMNKGLVANYSNFSVSGVTITGTKNVGGISGIIATQALNGATVKNVTLVSDDNGRVGIVAGSFGGTSTITNVTVENVTGATAIIGGTYKTGAAVEAKIGDTYYATFADALSVAFANAYANGGAKQTVKTAAGAVYATLGTWGGIDWTLYADGTLVIAPTAGAPVPDKNAPTKRTYEVGEWRETVVYNKNGGASSIGGAPYDMKAVKKLIIEEGVTKIGSFTCQFPNLTGEVVIPSTVTYFGQEAFHKTPITKLTFAAGGTEGLCIANGAFKKTLITEVSFPGDREYIHIHHWAFGGSTKLETAYIPANVTKCWGGEHVDYFDNFNSQTNVSWTSTSSIFTGCTAMQTITFENEAVRDLFFGSHRNSTAEDPMVAYAGLTAYNTFDEALAAALENGVTLGLAKNVTVKDTIVIPAGKTLTINLNGKTLSQSKACTASYEMILNKGSLTITGNGKISFTDTSAGDPNFGWGSYTIRNEGILVVENGTIEHKGAQAFATHMICAIFQYSGSTTINGGTISTPNYRSIRLWKGDMTINGGTFDGQVWVQAVDNSAKLTITGGTFEPNGQDASSVFVSNADYDVEFVVTNGTFNGKIGANKADKLAGAVTGGLFNEAAKNGTNADLLSDGSIFGNLIDGYYSIVKAIASVNDVEYESLSAAINAANAGDTITFLADINENVTINKNLTIDGADKNYTGTMTINNVTVTIENVNFVKGQVYKNKSTGNAAKITIKNCDFDGQGMNAYAINLGGTNAIVLENVTAKDYGYGLLQVPSSCAGLTVKNVTVSGCYYGLKVDYANAVSLENVNIDATTGIYDSNYGTKTYTIKNSKISSISIWQRNTTNYTTFKFEGVNEVATLSTSVYAKYVGVEVAGKIYGTLAEAWAAAEDGNTIKLLGNIATTEAITNTKKVTFDLNGKTIAGTDNGTASFGLITNKGELTITGNGKMTLFATSNRGWNAYSSVISNTVGGKLIVENGTIEHLGGTDMAYAIDNLTNGKGTYAETIINGGTIKSTYRAIRMFLNGVEAQNILTVNGGTIEGTNKSIWVQDPSKNNNSGKITVAAGAVLNGDVYLFATAGSTEWPVEVSIAASAVTGEVITGNMPNGYILEKKSGNWTVNEYIAKVGNKYYKTLQAAVDAANQYQSVTLLQDAEGAGVVINKKTTIDFNGFTYAVNTPVGSTGTESNGFQILAGNYTVRLLNGTLKVADDAADKFYILVQNYSDLIVQKMTLDGTNLDKYAFTDGDSYTLSNNSGNVQINDSKIIANNDGDLAFAFDACDKSAWGYELPSVLVYASSTIEGKIEAAAKVGQRYYATFEQAFKAAEEGKTITLLAPIVVNAGETLNLNKKVTINYTSSVAGEDMITVRGILIVDGATLVYNNKDVTGSNVTVSTISAEPGSTVEIKSGVVKNNSKNNGSLGIYAFAIDMLTNGNLGHVTVTISGGEVISTNYMAIRQFNNGTACNNTLTVTDGYIYGAKRAIQIHMDNNAAYLTISGGTIEAGDYALCLFPKTATHVAVTGGKFIGTIYSGTNGIITGGTYDEAVYEGYITESYKTVKTDNGYEVIFDEAYGSVATINGQTYKTFAAAWAAATDGDTIVLQNNITIDTETFTVADGKKITLDMNGYTITVTDNSTKNYELFYIYGEMVVTGKGVIELSATNEREWNASSSIFHNRGGVLTIENGTFTHNGGTAMAYVIDNSGNWYGDAVTNINGGTLTSSYTAIRNRMEQNTHGASGKAILNVYGGKIDGTSRAIWAQAASTSTVAPATGEINVYGGEIGFIYTSISAGANSMTTITGGTVASFKGESGELKVNGGTVTGDIAIYYANGDVAQNIVIKSKVYYGAVAKMGSTYYATLADALKKCTGAQAITLLRDIEGEGFVITGKTALDFNGHTYTVTAPVAGTNVGVQINTTAAVRLINGTLEAAENSGVEVLVENKGSALTIQKQTLTVTSGTALVVTGGSVSINIATINAEGAVAFEIEAGKITVYSEGKSSFIKGEKLAKKSGSNYTVA